MFARRVGQNVFVSVHVTPFTIFHYWIACEVVVPTLYFVLSQICTRETLPMFCFTKGLTYLCDYFYEQALCYLIFFCFILLVEGIYICSSNLVVYGEIVSGVRVTSQSSVIYFLDSILTEQFVFLWYFFKSLSVSFFVLLYVCVLVCIEIKASFSFPGIYFFIFLIYEKCSNVRVFFFWLRETNNYMCTSFSVYEINTYNKGKK